MTIYVVTLVFQLDSLSSEAAVAITFVLTFIFTLIVTAVITFTVTYICVKCKFKKLLQDLKDNQQNKAAFYESVGPSSQTITKDMALQPNPAYGTSQKVVMDTNPAYESSK